MRIVRIVLIVLAAIVALALAAAAWLFGTESGARAALSLASGAPLQLSGVHGRLVGPLRIDRIVIDQPSRRIVLDKVRLDWKPSALMRGLLHVESLHAQMLTVAAKVEQQQEPAKLPDGIDLPVAFRLDHARIDRGEVAWGPLNVISLGTLAFNADFDHARYRFRLDKFDASSATAERTVAATLSGEATLSTVRPYALRADFGSSGNAELEDQVFDGKGVLHAEGTLEQIAANIDFAVNAARVRGHSVLRPFSEQALGDTRIDIAQLDLAAFGKGLPQTALDARVAIGADGKGTLELRNGMPGPASAHKLPLATLRADIVQRGGAIGAERLRALLGTPREPAGSIGGGGSFRDGKLDAALTITDLNLKRLDPAMQATRLNGTLGLHHAEGRQQFSVDLTEPLGKRQLALSAAASMADRKVAIERAELRLGDGRLKASGQLDLAERQAFSIDGTLERFRPQDLGSFPQLPAMDLNGDFSLHGARAPALSADLAFRIADSRIAGQPLRGDGQARLRAERIDVPKLFLLAGDNRLDASGSLADDKGMLTFSIAAPKLEQLGSGFGGALDVSGTARGTLTRPRIALRWDGQRLRLPGRVQIEALEGKADIAANRAVKLMLDSATVDASARGLQSGEQRAAGVTLHAQFAPRPRAPLALDLRATGIVTPQLRADNFQATAQGTTGQHVLAATVQETGGRQNWAFGAQGGLHDPEAAPRWQGTIDRFDAQGRFAARLTAPAPLSVSQQRVALEDFALDANSIRMSVDRFVRDRNGIATRGRIDRLFVAQLLKFVEPQPALSTDLEIAGDWDVTIGDTVKGSASLRRVGGDVVMRSGSPLALGLRRLDAHATARNGQLQVRFDADGAQLGRIEIHAATDTAAGGEQFSIGPEAPVSGTALIDIPSLAWAGALIGPDAIAGGRLRADVALKGTLSDPQIAGTVGGSDLQLSLGDIGLDLRQGVLDGEFRNDTLQLRRLAFQGGNGGTLTLSGPVSFAGGKPGAQIALQAERFMLLNGADRKLVLSGASTLALRDGAMKVAGNFTVDSGDFDIGREDMPRLSEDVVIVGREAKANKPTRSTVDIGIDLGDKVTLRGRGINATLAGEVRVTSEPGEIPRARGSVRIAKGTFKAYGRELAIEQGVLRFNGAINNPALDIVAMRRDETLTVEAGVAVRGTVLAPRITLVSEPSVPDAEKLSWLVLGRSLDTAGSSDVGTLQNAAGKLLQQGALSAVQSRLATAFGLDDFRISTSPDNLEQRIVTLGKRVSSRLYVSIEQSLKTAGSVVLLRYALRKNLTVEAEAGARSTLSLLYNIAFD
jgi:translocation and assembly module TamB